MYSFEFTKNKSLQRKINKGYLYDPFSKNQERTIKFVLHKIL